MVGGGIRKFMNNTDGPAFLERELPNKKKIVYNHMVLERTLQYLWDKDSCNFRPHLFMNIFWPHLHHMSPIYMEAILSVDLRRINVSC